MKKMLLIVSGIISLSLGVTGVLLPVLPTTPFLLLAAVLFMKCSPRLYNWLLEHKILGLYVKSYLQYRAITRKAKIISISALWIVISSSAFFFVDQVWIRVLLGIIAVGVTVFLLQIKTLTKELLENEET